MSKRDMKAHVFTRTVIKFFVNLKTNYFKKNYFLD